LLRLKARNDDFLEVSQQDRWTAPLGDMTRNVLSQDLASRLPNGAIIPPDAPLPRTCPGRPRSLSP
jgi:uncharacterized lipoprotein YmbA